MGLTQVSTSGIKDATIATADIADDAVTAAKIADGTTDLVNDTSPQLGGDLASNGNNINMADDDIINVGSSNDLRIRHNGVNSLIEDMGTGNLQIRGDDIHITGTNDEILAKFIENTGVELYHDGSSKKFETTSTGAKVYGHLDLEDSQNIRLGNSQDFLLYHNGSHSIINDNGTGDLQLVTNNGAKITLQGGSDTMGNFIKDGAVELYHDNAKKLETTSSGATVTGTVVADNTAGRNIVINGDMRVAQRATSASFDDHGSEIEVCDRWIYNRHGVTATVAQVAEAPAGSGFKNSLKWTSTSAVSGSLHAGNVLKYVYKVETQDIQRLGYGGSDAKTATLSFWVRGSLSGKVGVSFIRDSKIFSANESIVANTWKFVEIVIPADTSTAFSAGDTVSGFQIGICWGAGSNSTSGSANEWVNFHNAYSAGFTANEQGAYLTTSGSTFQITGVQLEIGSKATPFAHRPIAEETALCERYYQAFVTGGSQYFATGYYYTSSSVFGVITHRTRMRAAPTFYQTTGTDYYYIYRDGNGDSFSGWETFSWKNGITGNLRVLSGVSGTAGHAGGLYTSNSNARIAFDAEL